jgi:hypothetical protein
MALANKMPWDVFGLWQEKKMYQEVSINHIFML